MAEPVPRNLVSFAEALAERSRAILVQRFRSALAVEHKADDTPVTAADREVETALRQAIGTRFPEHGVLGEEHGAERLDAEWVWVLDPIDGTRPFATGNPLFVTLIALLHRGRPVVGVIDAPIPRERWVGAAGHGTKWNGTRVAVRARRPLAEAVLYAAVPRDDAGLAGYRRLTKAVRWTVHDQDGYAYGLLARGGVDLVVEPELEPYDWCALAPVVEGAGGWIAHWDGTPLGLEGDGTVVAATDRALADEAVAQMQREG